MGRVGRSASQSCDDLVGDPLRSAQDIGLPDAQDGPAGLPQHAGLLTITFDVPTNLRDPVRRVVTSAELREPLLQVTSVPEVAVAEDHESMPREHDVRAARQPRNVEAVAKAATPELTPEGKFAASVRLRAGASCRRGRALRGRMQRRERGRGARALARLHRNHILLAIGGSFDRLLVNRPPLRGADLLTALSRSRPAGPFREHDRASETASARASAFSGSRSAITPATSPSRRTPRTLALSRRSPASHLAGLLFTAPPPRVGGGRRMAPQGKPNFKHRFPPESRRESSETDGESGA